MKFAGINLSIDLVSSIGTRLFREDRPAVTRDNSKGIPSTISSVAIYQRGVSVIPFYQRGPVRNRTWIIAVTALLFSGLYHRAQANPLFELLEGADWNLPIVPSAYGLIQRGMYQSSGTSYGARGETTSGPSTTEYLGITSLFHVFSYEALPNVGFAWEVLQPEVSVQPPGYAQSVSGLGDPLLYMSVYTRPLPNLMVGLQSFTSFPTGDSEVSSHRFEYIPHIAVDYTLGQWGFDGTFGAALFSTQHNGIDSVRSGNQYSAETALRYRVNGTFEPYVVNTYQTQNSGTTVVTKSYIPGNHQDDVGGGVKINFTQKRWISIWYYNTISGENVSKTNAAYFQFVNLF
jgi:hypothetical protein